MTVLSAHGHQVRLAANGLGFAVGKGRAAGSIPVKRVEVSDG